MHNWWIAVDKPILTVFFILEICGLITIFTSSPAIGSRIGLSPDYFWKRHSIYFFLSVGMMIICSFLNERSIKLFVIYGIIICITTMCIVLGLGTEIKGAKRWLYIGVFSIQPSEFIKPLFAVLIAFFIEYIHKKKIFYITISSVYLIIAGLLILQPDFGMLITITLILLSEIFLYGISFKTCTILMILMLLFSIISYYSFPHFQNRVLNFLSQDPESNFQVIRALKAFNTGGILGTGLGEGQVKYTLPDTHTDFIFALLGEETGLIGCMLIMSTYIYIIFRAIFLIIARKDFNNFYRFAIFGLSINIFIQSFINIGVNLNILPTKGMTLPFISYGGSSNIAMGITAGLILALTKKRM